VNIYATKVVGTELDQCVKGVVFAGGCDWVTWVNDDVPHKEEVLGVVMCARATILGSSGGITIPSVWLGFVASMPKDHLLYISGGKR
jgi:hypothetical protein